mmetsp:Transcript_104059/g.269395  ORF Transcript_104059/g.269395 Transcript_104059/m.269395 type:complete len:368 (-) Transcript_104059:227-1330(-)
MAASSGRSKGGDPKGLYETLGVQVTAADAEIKKAYRRLALRWHPDKNPDNPEATAEFQKISAAYEVLSDGERRQLYDSTGCVDAEELDDGTGFEHAADLFAAFFSSGAGNMDLDPEEQAMFDEFLRIAGGGAFRGGRGRRRRGRGRGGARASGSARARQAKQDEMLGEVLMGAMFGGLGAEMSSAALPCPKGHGLKRRKADAEYACDVCGRSIVEGKKFLDCRKCDFSLCQKCGRNAEADAAAQQAQQEEDEQQQMLEAICEMSLTPIRQGSRLRVRCNLCNAVLPSHEAGVSHIQERHGDEIEAMMEEMAMPDDMLGGGMFGGGGGDLEELLMAGMMSDMMGGVGGASGGSGGRSGGAGQRSRRRR